MIGRGPIPALLVASLALAGCAATPRDNAPGPNPQLAASVADRLSFYRIDVAPETLTTAQASALHLLMVSERGYLTIQRKARAILTNPDFAD
ncbi:hypothetical protein OCGS_2083 [Oceaniovalibus guishaninsula JLT2003]|uniref:Lipoprotein n=1 Tax=Oceaniovalibus guishaninsula JLT2003 TaxID=1231392 RepID=K2HLI2_9RHOB|nr:hypothetical protein [Oceaniovalibus guishaninsula]EKE43749.1 hypothetical protein OCGS_2083 [Oceaniovalibus guishaninsula JLT2003]